MPAPLPLTLDKVAPPLRVCTQGICDFHVPHTTIVLPTKYYLRFFSKFLTSDDCQSQEELKTMLMHNIVGKTKLHCRERASRESRNVKVQVEIKIFSLVIQINQF